MGESGFVLEERVLCSDDTCIGLVGADGRCRVCGLVYTGSETIPVSDDLPLETNPTGDPPDEPPPETGGAGIVSAEDDDRICCPDDTCVGIIGKDGKCGTCGKMP
jgi:hypothetical protein